MINSTCKFEEPLFVIVTHWITSFISIPTYGIALSVLLMKCPKYFNEFRNYLVVHIFSGILLDIHLSVIWKMSVILPWAAVCSNGLAAEYSVNLFQILIVLLGFTGASALSLFVYRMKAATKYVENAPFQKLVIFLKNMFYVSISICVILSIVIYPDLKYQKKYKLKKEQLMGKLPEYMWCDSCYFMQFDSRIFSTFYAFCYCALMFGFTSGVLAAFEAYRSLNYNNLRLSPKTAAIQKNLLFSLLAAIIVHITLIFVPLALFFIANVTVVNAPYLAPFLVIMLQDHGSVSTFTMFVTNNLLRKATKKLFLMPENLMCRSEQKVFQTKKMSGVHVLTAT